MSADTVRQRRRPVGVRLTRSGAARPKREASMRPTVAQSVPGSTLPLPRVWIILLAAGLCWMILVALVFGGAQLAAMIASHA